MHSIKDILSVCELCAAENNLIRIPQLTITPLKNKEAPKKVGSLVNEYIEDAREELKQYKKEVFKKEASE